MKTFFYSKLQFLNASQAWWSFLLKHMCEVMTNKKGCNSLLIAELNTLWYVDFEFFFLSYYFLELMYFFFRIHITTGWRRDTRMILRSIWILIQICGWRQLMRLPTAQHHHYVTENWKRITANAIVIFFYFCSIFF